MATIKEIKTEIRHREWMEQIQECQNSGQTVKEWCKGIKENRHIQFPYRHKKIDGRSNADGL